MKNLLFALSLLLILQSCIDSDDNPSIDSVCDQVTIVDNALYNNNVSESFSIKGIQLVGDCLEVEIQSSGCDGGSWEVKLVDSGGIAESIPEQRYLKVFLNNEELCEAIILKTYNFDLRPLRTGNDVVLLNLEKWDHQIRYEY